MTARALPDSFPCDVVTISYILWPRVQIAVSSSSSLTGFGRGPTNSNQVRDGQGKEGMCSWLLEP